ncbi:SRPBCC domain-containing protein [Amycolatopsis sp. NPDC051903]|uniref:SRPBCC domain-containing protein n=1 Tax=Amycolatopsis sp. NPDC051903 TaxID=3363936 RepID=UPI00379D3B59
MGREIEVTWDGVLAGSPEQVWDAFTNRTGGWLWPITYEPRRGGAERGLTPAGGTVLEWDPARRFVTRAEQADGWFNQLGYDLEPVRAGTRLHYTHRTVLGDDHEVQLDSCLHHTKFYYHSLTEYVRCFAGRDAAYVSAQAPASSADGGFDAVCRALGAGDAGVGAQVVAKGPVTLAGVVDYRTDRLLGIRTDSALFRVYGRDAWGWPVAVAVHDFAAGAGGTEEDWTTWLAGVFGSAAGA